MPDSLDNLRKSVERQDLIRKALTAFLMPPYKPMPQYWTKFRIERAN